MLTLGDLEKTSALLVPYKGLISMIHKELLPKPRKNPSVFKNGQKTHSSSQKRESRWPMSAGEALSSRVWGMQI